MGSTNPKKFRYRVLGGDEPYFQIEWEFEGKLSDVQVAMMTWDETVISDYLKFVLDEFWKSRTGSALRKALPLAFDFVRAPNIHDYEWAWDSERLLNTINTVDAIAPLYGRIIGDINYQNCCTALLYEQIFWYEIEDMEEPREVVDGYRELWLGTTDIFKLMFQNTNKDTLNIMQYARHFVEMIPGGELDEYLAEKEA